MHMITRVLGFTANPMINLGHGLDCFIHDIKKENLLYTRIFIIILARLLIMIIFLSMIFMVKCIFKSKRGGYTMKNIAITTLLYTFIIMQP